MPEPDWLDHALPVKHICLLTNDGTPTTSEVIELLIQQSWQVVLLSFPEAIMPLRSLPQGVNQIVLEDLSEEHLKQQLAIIEATYGAIAAFIHLHPACQIDRTQGVHLPQSDKAILKQVFFLAKHLKPSLSKTSIKGRSSFLTVARLDGEFGFRQAVSYSPISAGLFGLTKSLNFEWKSIFCRAIDLSPDIDSKQSAHHILAELHDPDWSLVEVGYGPQGRSTLVVNESSSPITG